MLLVCSWVCGHQLGVVNLPKAVLLKINLTLPVPEAVSCQYLFS